MDAARRIEAAGADTLLVCTNTMHKLAEEIEAAIGIPLLHIADATGQSILAMNAKKIGLLGTAFTMEQDFYKGRLRDKFGLEVSVPQAEDRKIIHRIIYQELCLGKVLPESRAEFMRIVEGMESEGVEAVVLGCTEIGMLLKPIDVNIPLLDTMKIHARQAVAFALLRPWL